MVTWSDFAPALLITSVTIPFPPLLLEEPLPDTDALDDPLPTLEDTAAALELMPALDVPTELDAPVDPDAVDEAPLEDAADDAEEAPLEEEEPPHSHGVNPVRSALQFWVPMVEPTQRQEL